MGEHRGQVQLIGAGGAHRGANHPGGVPHRETHQLLGGVFGVIGVYLRRWLSDTPVFMAMEAQREARVELPLRTVLRARARGLDHVLARLADGVAHLVHVAVPPIVTAEFFATDLFHPNDVAYDAWAEHIVGRVRDTVGPGSP